MSIESEDLGSGGIPHVRLGSTSWCACDANRPGHRTDGSRSWTDELRGQADESEGQADASNTSNRPETVEMSCGEGAGAYWALETRNAAESRQMALGARRTRRAGTGDVPSVDTDTIKPTNSPENISTSRKKTKLPDSPIKAARPLRPDGPNTFGNPTDAQSVADNTKTAENETESVNTRRNGSKMPNSPVEAARQRPDGPNDVRDHMVGLRGHTDTHSVGNGSASETETCTYRETCQLSDRLRTS